MQNPMISMTEVQPLLSRLLKGEAVTPVRLGTAHVPLVAIVPWRAYLAWWGALWRAKECTLIEEIRSASEARTMFSSYRSALAPLLTSEGQILRVVVIKALKREVGAVLAWVDWLRFALADSPAAANVVVSPPDRTLTVVSAHKHLSQLVDQFRQEAERGVLEAITVTKLGAPVMAIVPWALYQQWQAREAMKKIAPLSQAIQRDALSFLPVQHPFALSFADATVLEEVLTARKTSLQPTSLPGDEVAAATRTIIAHIDWILDQFVLFTTRDKLEDLIAYLEYRGWRREPHPNECLLKLVRPNPAGEPLVLFLPVRLDWLDDGSPEGWDAEELVSDAVRCQALIEHVIPYRVLTEMRGHAWRSA